MVVVHVSKYTARHMEKSGCPNCSSEIVKGFSPGADLECMGCRRVFVISHTPLNEIEALRIIMADGSDKDLDGNGAEAIALFITRILHFCHREEISFQECLAKANNAFEEDLIDEAMRQEKQRKIETAQTCFDFIGQDPDRILTLIELANSALKQGTHTESVTEKKLIPAIAEKLAGITQEAP